jgi:hypothetical protein
MDDTEDSTASGSTSGFQRFLLGDMRGAMSILILQVRGTEVTPTTRTNDITDVITNTLTLAFPLPLSHYRHSSFGRLLTTRCAGYQ